ncbi:Hypothetical protein PHPALM_9328 [Phytophthora palmivora]|uniref:PiggyBac transposable element-derived protein domain-containing protein n=1 Tax=Phytophthora palmivora TaxID=4796 RepID=A0A2P4Y7K9_9STRA|nr:Hypothetical protein PHPALM_9328 [Phytophthora palmivora]
MIPSRSRHNITRQFLKDKPHKWGTKLLMTCCTKTAYCLRLLREGTTRKRAIVRDLSEVLPLQEDGGFHAVVTDRFYTSVQLALQLLSRNEYSIGTVQPNRAGNPKEVTSGSTTRPPGVYRGSTRIAVAKCVPHRTALLWWERMPVQFLAIGGSRALKTCGKAL